MTLRADVKKAMDDGCSLPDLADEFPDKDRAYIAKLHKEYSAKLAEDKEKTEKSANKSDYKAEIPAESSKQKAEGETIDEADEEGETETEESKGTSEGVILAILGAGALWAFWPQISERLLPGRAQKPLEDW